MTYIPYVDDVRNHTVRWQTLPPVDAQLPLIKHHSQNVPSTQQSFKAVAFIAYGHLHGSQEYEPEGKAFSLSNQVLRVVNV